MSRIAYVNGQYLPQADASVNVEDRGYQFADGVYEVVAAVGGKFIDLDRHFSRLERSLSELRMNSPCSRRVLDLIAREVLRRNNVRDGILYIQITRGVAPRSHAFPGWTTPSLVMTASRRRRPGKELIERGVSVVTLEDNRWRRTDIKSVSLLANVLSKQLARDVGAYEAWLVDDDGFVTEGTSTNAWIVTGAGEVLTRPPDHAILAGVTRLAVLDAAEHLGVSVVQRPFSVAEALAAAEAFMTSTTSFVLPVTTIDGREIGGGGPGPVTRRLMDGYGEHVNGGRGWK